MEMFVKCMAPRGKMLLKCKIEMLYQPYHHLCSLEAGSSKPNISRSSGAAAGLMPVVTKPSSAAHCAWARTPRCCFPSSLQAAGSVFVFQWHQHSVKWLEMNSNYTALCAPGTSV